MSRWRWNLRESGDLQRRVYKLAQLMFQARFAEASLHIQSLQLDGTPVTLCLSLGAVKRGCEHACTAINKNVSPKNSLSSSFIYGLAHYAVRQNCKGTKKGQSVLAFNTEWKQRPCHYQGNESRESQHKAKESLTHTFTHVLGHSLLYVATLLFPCFANGRASVFTLF